MSSVLLGIKLRAMYTNKILIWSSKSWSFINITIDKSAHGWEICSLMNAVKIQK